MEFLLIIVVTLAPLALLFWAVSSPRAGKSPTVMNLVFLVCRFAACFLRHYSDNDRRNR